VCRVTVEIWDTQSFWKRSQKWLCVWQCAPEIDGSKWFVGRKGSFFRPPCTSVAESVRWHRPGAIWPAQVAAVEEASGHHSTPPWDCRYSGPKLELSGSCIIPNIYFLLCCRYLFGLLAGVSKLTAAIPTQVIFAIRAHHSE